jgi:hypothetical protein
MASTDDGEPGMTSLFGRLDLEETVARGELNALRQKLTVAEERLAHLTITRETLVVKFHPVRGQRVVTLRG